MKKALSRHLCVAGSYTPLLGHLPNLHDKHKLNSGDQRKKVYVPDSERACVSEGTARIVPVSFED